MIRRATASDGAAVADIFVRSRLASVPAIPPLVNPDGARTWMTGVVADGQEVWVSQVPDGGPLVALMLLRDDWIMQLYVHPDWTGQGLGSELVDVAKRERPEGLQLWTFQSNVRARRFYERHGFMAVEETDGSGNMERQPDVRYEWR